MRDAWPQVLDAVREEKLNAWLVLQTAQVRAFDTDVLTIAFMSNNDVDSFKQPNPSGDGVSEHLRRAILLILGIKVKFIARVEQGGAADSARATPTVAPVPVPERVPDPEPAQTPPAPAPTPAPTSTPAQTPTAATTVAAPDAGGWAVAAIPQSEQSDSSGPVSRAVPTNSTPTAPAPPTAPAAPEPQTTPPTGEAARYGESVVREILGASFIEEQPVAPKVIPLSGDF